MCTQSQGLVFKTVDHINFDRDTVHVDSSLKELETVSISKKKTTVESTYILG